MSEYKCERCKREFDENEYEITEMENSCILHLDKIEENDKNCKIYNHAFDEYVQLELKYGKRISFYYIIFLKCLNEKDYRHLEEIKFTGCKFYKNLHFANSEKVFYDWCDFYVDWNSINYKNLFTIRKYLFNNCHFYEKLENRYSENSKIIYDSKLFNNCTFHKNIRFLNGIFNEKIFKDCNFDNKIKLEIEDSDIKRRFEINRKNIFQLLNFKDSIFLEKVKIKRCYVENANFFNTTFNELADFYKTEFEKVDFEKTDFEKISVFSECEFNCDVDFKHTKFLGKTLFQDTVIKGKLNLRNSIFDDEVNFLDITSIQREVKDGQFIGEPSDIKVANRETARKIKHFYDSTNNVIEANRFYKLEMKKREEELDKKSNFFDWLVFKIHGLTSNHSQDWTLALYWILIIGASFSFINNCTGFWSLFITVIFSMIIFFCNNFDKWIKLLLFYGLYILKTGDVLLHDVVKVINPFEKSSGIGLIEFLSKIIIAYLIYQLIVSIRQNTRRK
ncbi:pentapeptide repeat-containing protein [Halarcobacter sp.]|uniref:pentapeptide repeat-containing protein n=1 Tax=Halarcobacter sp. TaxID=2321133 RepID=UPI003A8CED73